VRIIPPEVVTTAMPLSPAIVHIPPTSQSYTAQPIPLDANRSKQTIPFLVPTGDKGAIVADIAELQDDKQQTEVLRRPGRKLSFEFAYSLYDNHANISRSISYRLAHVV
jgi:hypothetical protein